MSVAIVCMVRDEIDVIDAFLEHHLSLADLVLVADHLSTDGTFELLQARAESEPRLKVYCYDYEQQFQSAVVTALVNQAVDLGHTWAVPLDADEFLPFHTAGELESKMSSLESPIVHFRWQNLVPVDLPTDATLNWDAPFLSSPDLAPTQKVAVSREYAIREPGFRIDEGSHGVAGKKQGWFQSRFAGPLLHIPIRSMEQAMTKFGEGSRTLSKEFRRPSKKSTHWYVFHEEFSRALSTDDVHSLALMYDKRVLKLTEEERQAILGQAEQVFFVPNGHFAEPVSVGEPVARQRRMTRMMSTEAEAIVGTRVIELRRRRWWWIGRIRMLARDVRDFVRSRLA